MTLQRPSKYKSRVAEVAGLRFDSKAEARRYSELVLLEAAGAITGLEVHPRFELQPAFTDGSGKRWAVITYEADFSYTEDGAPVVEDVKGYQTAVFRLKRKLFLMRYPALTLRVIAARGNGMKEKTREGHVRQKGEIFLHTGKGDPCKN